MLMRSKRLNSASEIDPELKESLIKIAIGVLWRIIRSFLKISPPKV